MTQLTELSIEQYGEYLHTQPDLARLPHLRKLTLGPAGEGGEHVESLRQLSQLRELTLHEDRPERIRLLCPPPHSLCLESLTLSSMHVNEVTMRSLLHLPTLTALHSLSVMPAAWPLLPQLPRLRRLSLSPSTSLTPGQLSSLCASFSHCSALEDLSLELVHFEADDRTRLTAEQIGAGWAALLSSVPNLRRLGIDGDLTDLLPVLPLHLPLLEHLTLSGWCDGDVNLFASLAHPNIRLLEFGLIGWQQPSDEQMRACMHNERLPKLERCVRAARLG
jgi:hypothetical protein